MSMEGDRRCNGLITSGSRRPNPQVSRLGWTDDRRTARLREILLLCQLRGDGLCGLYGSCLFWQLRDRNPPSRYWPTLMTTSSTNAALLENRPFSPGPWYVGQGPILEYLVCWAYPRIPWVKRPGVCITIHVGGSPLPASLPKVYTDK